MQIAYELTWPDYLKFTLGHQFCSAVAQVFFVGTSFALAWQLGAETSPAEMALYGLALYGGLWLVQALFTVLYLRFGRNPSLLGPHRFEIGPQGFADETATGRHEHLWSAVTRVAERLGQVALYVDAHHAYFVPARAFSSPALRGQFLATVDAGRARIPGPGAEMAPPAVAAPSVHVGPLGVLHWLAYGLSAGFGVRPRLGNQSPGPWQFLAVLVVAMVAQVALERAEISGAASFNTRVWVAGWWVLLATVLAAWMLLRTAPRQVEAASAEPIARWLAIWLPACLPAVVAGVLVAALGNQEMLPQNLWFSWGLYLLLWAWALGVAFIAARTFLNVPRAWALTAVVLATSLLSESLFPHRIWYVAPTQGAGEDEPRLKLSQEVFEQQQALWSRSVQNLAPDRPGVADVYAIVFAPYAGEDVFLRESTMVAQVLGERFDAAGRTLHLVNHAATAATHLWATPANLQRAVQAVAARMDRSNDILMVYMTSHGAQDFKLAASHWPLEVAPVAPALLRAALDEAGIRHRVIAVSACYSGGWIAPLASETSLVMTASDATHTSYGCGRKSELTFFGRAVFDEQLRKTRSFEKAFAAAVPIIDQREKEGGKPDGFSNPQISVGAAIRPVLQSLEQRLEQR